MFLLSSFSYTYALTPIQLVSSRQSWLNQATCKFLLANIDSFCLFCLLGHPKMTQGHLVFESVIVRMHHESSMKRVTVTVTWGKAPPRGKAPPWGKAPHSSKYVKKCKHALFTQIVIQLKFVWLININTFPTWCIVTHEMDPLAY